MVYCTRLQKAAATWILKTRECHRLPLSVMDSIIFDVQSLYDVALSQLGDHINHILSEAGVDQGAMNSVAAEITNGPHMHIFDGLKTQSQQLAYYKEHFQFVVSAKYMYVYMSCTTLLFNADADQSCAGNT